MGRALLCLIMLLAAVGCAAPARADPPREAAQRFYAAVGGGRGEAACALLAPRAEQRLAEEHGSCAHGVLALGLRGGTVRGVSVWGGEAQVRMTEDTVFLHEYPAGWRIRGAGCEPRPPAPYDCEVET
ncbi:hypothetical protein Misp01_65570 [Microtetraspora sp. NBRC 13810]|uniref:hypothetical protein n=1 Tax=Microtetraspora sp. NBRC 13810 TaxID=3030990 RepID=UPI0024A2A0EB|nr:hypothetical protein [Microtetraspora sp. NBRC 13810]GLW11429.1 hypothetical protein Misp01_65570 [Microtetraspora sp. NBRC 13810]